MMKNFLLVVTSLLLTFLFFEGFLRIFPPQHIIVNNPYVFTEVIGKRVFLQPFRSYKERYPLRFDSRGYYAKSQGIVDYHTNQYGARWIGATEQPVQTDNVLVMGDSFTYGFGLRYEDTYIFRLERLLAANRQTTRFLNVAVPAANVQEMLRRYKEQRDSIPHNFILYGLHLNDLLRFPTSFITTHTNTWLGGITTRLAQVSVFFGFIGHRIHIYLERERNIQKLLDPSQFESEYFRKNMKAMRQLNTLARERNILFQVALLPMLVDLKNGTFDPVYSGIRNQLEEYDIPYIDLTDCLKDFEDQSMWILPFDQHPNEIANRIFADKLSKAWLASH